MILRLLPHTTGFEWVKFYTLESLSLQKSRGRRRAGGGKMTEGVDLYERQSTRMTVLEYKGFLSSALGPKSGVRSPRSNAFLV